MKRIFDIIFSTIVLLLFVPLGFLVAICVSIDSRGGVFYRQERVGKNGKLFKLLKFRSMHFMSDKNGSLTVGQDARITTIGRIIRKFKIDEFPQFINVILGDMSVVGPRPEVKEFVDLYTESQREILTVRPGITDEASLAYFEENKLLATSIHPKKTYIEEIMPAKIAINLKYMESRSLISDFSVIGRTVMRICKA